MTGNAKCRCFVCRHQRTLYWLAFGVLVSVFMFGSYNGMQNAIQDGVWWLVFFPFALVTSIKLVKWMYPS